jgi:hypothetical protein
MAFSTEAFKVQVDYLLSADDDELPEIARIAQIDAAIERYSLDLPNEVTKDVSGDGGNYYAISGLTSWSDGYSQILAIEYPAPTVASDEAPVYLEPDDWNDDYWDGSTRYIYLPNHAPASGESMRVRYTAPYVNSSDTYDIPPKHFYAVCMLAAGLCAQAISAKYSRTSDSTVSLDSVDHLSRAQQWAQRADEFIADYRDRLNLADDGTEPYGEFVDWDTRPSDRRTWLYH